MKKLAVAMSQASASDRAQPDLAGAMRGSHAIGGMDHAGNLLGGAKAHKLWFKLNNVNRIVLEQFEELLPAVIVFAASDRDWAALRYFHDGKKFCTAAPAFQTTPDDREPWLQQTAARCVH